MNVRFLTAAILLPTLFPMSGQGQNVSVDEGSFRIYLQGSPAGRESFSIRQIGSGPQPKLLLIASVDLQLPEGAVTLAPAMEAQGGTLSVSDYQIKVAGAETTDIFVSLSGNRFLVRTLSASGEQLREFRAGSGSVLLDDGIVHHHHLLSSYLEAGSPVSLTVLTPRAGRQDRMTFSLVGHEEIRVGDLLVPDARRYRLEGADRSRDIWFDSQGRILRLEIPSQGYLAEREGLSPEL